MSRYYFNVENGKHIDDDEGSDLPDLSAVRRLALRTMGELLREGCEKDEPHRGLTIHVLNEDNVEIMTVRVTVDEAPSG
jgi:hypothetical protein